MGRRIGRWTSRASRTPRSVDEIEAVIQDIWTRALDVESVGRTDDFFALGGDSLAAVYTFAEIEDRLGIERPVSSLLYAPTVGRLAALLAVPAAEEAVVIPVHPRGSRPALVAVHGGHGGVLWSHALSERLGVDQPVLALQPPAFGRLESMPSLPDLAAYYLAEVEDALGAPPPVLFGYSLGGTLAFEMALQLQARGVPPDLVAIGDMPLVGGPTDPEPRADTAARLERLGRIPVGDLRRLAARTTRPAWERRLLNRRDRYTGTFRRLLTGYRTAGAFIGDLVLFRSTMHRELGSMGWETAVDGTVDVVPVEASHHDLVRPPAVEHVAAVLSGRIDELTRRARST